MKRSSSTGVRVAHSHGCPTSRCLHAPVPGPPRILLALAGPLPLPAGMGRSELRREQSRVGRTLACDAAAALCGGNPASFTVVGGGNSPPSISSAASGPLVVGLTHSGEWVVAAVSTLPVRLGIDVQQVPRRPVRQFVAFMDWTRHLATPIGSDAMDQLRFTQLWSLWEAAVKCDGVTVLAPSTPAFERLRFGCKPVYDHRWSAGGYSALSRRLDDSHWLAVVVRDAHAGSPHIEWLPPAGGQHAAPRA